MIGWMRRRTLRKQLKNAKKGPSVTHVLEKGTIERIRREIERSECVILLLTELGQFDHDPILRKQMKLGIKYQKPIILLALSDDGRLTVPDDLTNYAQYHGYVLHNGTDQDVKERFYGIIVSWDQGKRRYP